ncbi:class I SAM-dependent methyltransferase [Fodinibius halophilus]|uniref:Class I SAM-dependent methyltransferase n=1 Tax=Fodinibius halophilus TaxID=1736908 RepID=A0A6M1TE98_9BACT|nr:class I SAM-dependent methyltransferase [Fodinibius halophilus]NGP88512.1 class I SAM-dependent methyltransferase [Fodinibius halophilus]
MSINIMNRIPIILRSQPDPRFIAQQLRRPSGDFAQEIGQKMDIVNKPLFDLTLEVLNPQQNDRILEIGFGTGKFFKKLISFEENINISGIDYSEEMVRLAKQNNPDLLASDKLDLRKGESGSLPFDDSSFDKVFCNMVIYFWEQPKKHLAEIYRILKPGGEFYTGMREYESMLVFPFVEHGFNLYKVDQWEDILGENGFSLLELRRQQDPPIEIGDIKKQLTSCCIAARKE